MSVIHGLAVALGAGRMRWCGHVTHASSWAGSVARATVPGPGAPGGLVMDVLNPVWVCAAWACQSPERGGLV